MPFAIAEEVSALQVLWAPTKGNMQRSLDRSQIVSVSGIDAEIVNNVLALHHRQKNVPEVFNLTGSPTTT